MNHGSRKHEWQKFPAFSSKKKLKSIFAVFILPFRDSGSIDEVNYQLTHCLSRTASLDRLGWAIFKPLSGSLALLPGTDKWTRKHSWSCVGWGLWTHRAHFRSSLYFTKLLSTSCFQCSARMVASATSAWTQANLQQICRAFHSLPGFYGYLRPRKKTRSVNLILVSKKILSPVFWI